MTAEAEARAAAGATRGSAIKLAAELLGRGMSLGTFLLLAPGLGAADFGTFSVLSVVAVVLAETGELGLQGLAAQALVTGELTIPSILRAKVVASGIGLIVVLGGAFYSRPLGILILFYLVAGWSELGGVVLRARGRAVAEAIVILCLRASGLLFVGGWIVTQSPSVVGIAWAQLASALPGVALAGWLLRRNVTEGGLHGASAGAVLRRSAPLAVNGGLALVSLRVELLALKWLRGATETGVFSVALRVIEFLSMVPAAVAGGAMPGLAREAGSHSAAVRQRSSWLVALLAGAACLGLMVTAADVVAVVGRGQYEAAGPVMRLLALSVVPLFANVLLSHALVAARRPERLPRLTALRVSLSFGLALVLTPRFGPMGAAAGFLASECVVLLVAIRACRAARFPTPVLVPFGAGIALAIPMAFTVASMGGRVELRIAAGIAVWAGTVGTAWWLRRRGGAPRGAGRGGPG